jgi:hypothetical protein
MADKHIANVESTWLAVCIPPDWCWVGESLIPFDSYRDLSHEMVASPNVNARGTPVYRITDWVQGTDSNAGNGIISGTSQEPGNVQMLSDDTTVLVNGLICARHETLVWMNYGAEPNTLGRLQTDQGPPLGTVANGKLPCNDPPKSSPDLEQLEKMLDAVKNDPLNPNQLDEYVRFADANKILDDDINSIRPGDDSYAITKGAAGVLRGGLGFVKDMVMGIGQLAYAIGKRAIPMSPALLQDQLEIAVLAENIRLGNICLETLKQAAKAAGKELAKPVTDAWERGDYAEAITRGGLEIGSLALMVGDLAKLAQVGKAAEAAKAGQAS